MGDAQQAFVLRISPSGVDRMTEALRDNAIIIGWCAPELLDQSVDWKRFREILYAQGSTPRMTTSVELAVRLVTCGDSFGTRGSEIWS